VLLDEPCFLPQYHVHHICFENPLGTYDVVINWHEY
jgi:hypothetical protein